MSFQHLQFIYARSVPLNYVSPPICEGDFSSTGEPVIILASLARLRGPTGLILGGSGGLRLSWDNFPGAICFNVYKLVDELDPFGPYELVAECISDNFIDLTPFGPGTFKITAITPNGETEPSEPIVIPPPPLQLSITTSELPEGGEGGDYFALVEAAGGVPGGVCGYTWAVIVGDLPDGLTLDPCSGEIIGIPTEGGDFPITIEVQDGNGTTATRAFTLAVVPFPQAWWRFEEATANEDHIDTVQGLLFSPQLFDTGVTVSTPPGILGSGLGMQGSSNTPFDAVICNFGNSFFPPPELGYDIEGVSLFVWVRFNSYNSNVNWLVLQYIAGTITLNIQFNSTTGGEIAASQSPDSLSFSVPFVPVLGEWYLIGISYDPGDKKIRLFINDNPPVESSAGVIDIFASSSGSIDTVAGASNIVLPTAYDFAIDELSVFQGPLSEKQVAFLWNEGAGRTFPF